VLPATSAAPAGPPDSANGKLKGAITSHGPYGRSTLLFSLTKPGNGSRAIGFAYPSSASIRSHEYAMRSAVSCASPSASMRFLPTSSASAAPR